MAEFAKSMFSFSGPSSKEQSPNQENQGDALNHQGQKDQDLNVSLYSINSTLKGSNDKFFPKGLVNVAPTTAISHNSFAYGTTSTKACNEVPLNETIRNQGRAATPLEYAQLTHNRARAAETNKPVDTVEEKKLPYSQQSNESHTQEDSSIFSSHHDSASMSSQPLIITTDEAGQSLNVNKHTQPKGKLKVTIIEAKDLLINSPTSQPYVVCTFQSSESVTNAPNSFGASSENTLHMIEDNNRPRRGRPFNDLRCNLREKKPIYKRQSSTQCLDTQKNNIGSANPVWNHTSTFDVVGTKSELDICVYDAAADDSFLGHVRIFPSIKVSEDEREVWVPLNARVMGESVSGCIKVGWEYTSLDKKLCGPEDFELLRLLGKGTFGQVFQVKKKDTQRVYAMKILSKKVIVKKKEIAHTIGERNILVRTSTSLSSFIIGLKFSFQTPTDLYLVTDYMSGGELFWHLQKEGRFPEDRAKFYIAELVLALEHLHNYDIVYRDLKPENILLDANGHIALCDFGLSKANLNNDGTTNTFCGTTEYLAPEVLLDESGYTKMVDFWSLGVLIFEMCCGWSPFYAENTQQMYKNIAFGKVRFPREVLSPEGRAFVKGLLNRNPRHRLGSIDDAAELKRQPFFQDIDWDLLRTKRIPPPFKPHLSSEVDTSNFDPEFTSESTANFKKQAELASTPLSPGMQANFKGFTYVDDSAFEDNFGKSQRMNTFKEVGSFIPGNPNLPPDEDVIDDNQDQIDDKMDIDDEQQIDQEQEELVNGRIDL